MTLETVVYSAPLKTRDEKIINTWKVNLVFRWPSYSVGTRFDSWQGERFSWKRDF